MMVWGALLSDICSEYTFEFTFTSNRFAMIWSVVYPERNFCKLEDYSFTASIIIIIHSVIFLLFKLDFTMQLNLL